MPIIILYKVNQSDSESEDATEICDSESEIEYEDNAGRRGLVRLFLSVFNDLLKSLSDI